MKSLNKKVISRGTKGRPILFGYTSYRTFLADFAAWRKSLDSRFSHRYIIMKLGCQSAGWFSDVVKGRLNLGGERLTRLMKLFELTPRECEFLEVLVNFECAISTEEKSKWFRKLSEFKETASQPLNPDQFEYFTEWYFCSIRESFFIKPFSGNYEELAKSMLPEISIEKAKQAVALLINLGLIEKNKQGNYIPTSKTIKNDTRYSPNFIRLYQKSNLQLAMRSIESISNTERNISSVSITLSAEEYQIACEEIVKLRKKLLQMSEMSQNPERVYQCNIQLFPQTR